MPNTHHIPSTLAVKDIEPPPRRIFSKVDFFFFFCALGLLADLFGKHGDVLVEGLGRAHVPSCHAGLSGGARR